LARPEVVLVSQMLRNVEGDGDRVIA